MYFLKYKIRVFDIPYQPKTTKFWVKSKHESDSGFLPEMRHEDDGERVRGAGLEKLRFRRPVHGAARWLDQVHRKRRVRLQADVWKLRLRHRHSGLLLLEADQRRFSRCEGLVCGLKIFFKVFYIFNYIKFLSKSYFFLVFEWNML